MAHAKLVDAKLEPGFRALTQLKVLEFANENATGTCIQSLPHPEKLTSLVLISQDQLDEGSCRSQSCFVWYGRLWSKFLPLCPNLKELRICLPRKVKAITTSVVMLQKLRSFSLVGPRFVVRLSEEPPVSEEFQKKLELVFRNLQNVEQLNVPMHCEELERSGNLIMNNCPKLLKLHISLEGRWVGTSQAWLDGFLGKLGNCWPGLEQLCIRYRRGEYEGPLVKTARLLNLSSLKCLELYCCRLPPQALFGFDSLTNLVKLKFDMCETEDDEQPTLTESLIQCWAPTCTHLHLNTCMVLPFLPSPF